FAPRAAGNPRPHARLGRAATPELTRRAPVFGGECAPDRRPGRAGRVKDVRKLREAIERVHRLRCTHVRSESFVEKSEGKRVWDGTVEVFSCTDNPSMLSTDGCRPTTGTGGTSRCSASRRSRTRGTRCGRTPSADARKPAAESD